MLKDTKYTCLICNSKPSQISHHKSHITTDKHKLKKELVTLQLSGLTAKQLIDKYNSDDIPKIINNLENNVIIKKKLNDNLNNKYIINMNEIIDLSNTISDKDALRDKIHEMHNYLRNHGAGYGMNALKVFNIIYGLKRLEEKNLYVKVEMTDDKCYFSNLLKIAKSGEDEQLADLIFNDVLDSINNSLVKDMLFYEIPKKLKSNVFSYLIKQVETLSMIEKKCQVLLSGKIYEYFIGRDESAISELGAYFTNRYIIDYIWDQLDIGLNEDGSVKTMIDPFGGSGGFTVGYINYLNKKFPDKINWETELHKIYHFDMNEDVIKSAALEFFCLTGVLPNMETNMGYKNSFGDEFCDQRFGVVGTNPPYGGDKNKKTAHEVKLGKVKEFIKTELKSKDLDEPTREKRLNQLKEYDGKLRMISKEKEKDKVTLKCSSHRINKFAKKYGLKGGDKEAVSLIQMMDMVEIGGVAVGVLKEGVFFNRTYKNHRRVLIENFNVKKIISVPQSEFENTGTKTSIVIFENTEEKTSVVEFYNLVLEKFTEDKFEEIEGYIVLTENKGDVNEVYHKLVSKATRKQILADEKVSLNGKEYNLTTIIPGDGYELVKFKDVCEILPKKHRYASFADENGDVDFYTSSQKLKKCKEADYNMECLVIGTGGNSCLHYVNQPFSVSGDTLLFKSSLYDNKYIYTILKSLWNYILGDMNGSTIKHINKKGLSELQIPIPTNPDKMKYWVDRINSCSNEKESNTIQTDLTNETIKGRYSTNFEEILKEEKNKNLPDKIYKESCKEEPLTKEEILVKTNVNDNNPHELSKFSKMSIKQLKLYINNNKLKIKYYYKMKKVELINNIILKLKY